MNGMAEHTVCFAKTLEGNMRTIKDIVTARKGLREYKRAAVTLAERYLELRAKYDGLLKEYHELLDTLSAERSQKERYRKAFLDRMNVPVTGKAWTGDGYFEES